MTGDAGARPVVQLIGTEGAGYCDPKSGVCVLPAAPEPPAVERPGERSPAAGAR
jgi:hypothetical protein